MEEFRIDMVLADEQRRRSQSRVLLVIPFLFLATVIPIGLSVAKGMLLLEIIAITALGSAFSVFLGFTLARFLLRRGDASYLLTYEDGILTRTQRGLKATVVHLEEVSRAEKLSKGGLLLILSSGRRFAIPHTLSNFQPLSDLICAVVSCDTIAKPRVPGYKRILSWAAIAVFILFFVLKQAGVVLVLGVLSFVLTLWTAIPVIRSSSIVRWARWTTLIGDLVILAVIVVKTISAIQILLLR